MKRIEAEIADYVLEDKILISYSKSILRTVENIQANAELVNKICNGKKYPLLIFIKSSPMPDKATRALSAKLLGQNYKAMAMVSMPGLSQMIMKLVFRFQKPSIPIEIFSNELAARNWLQQYYD